MLGHPLVSHFRRLILLALHAGACIAGAFCSLAPADDNTNASASVEQLSAMLQAIAPYRPHADAVGKVQVYGSTSMDALAHGWVTGFKQFHNKANVEISAANSDQSMSQLVASPSSIAMFSRPVKPAEIDELKKQGLKNPVPFIVAREALSVFVHATNPVTSISGEQLRDVFTTDVHPSILTWSALGATEPWASKEIHVISRSEKSGTQQFLSEFVFNGAHVRSGVSNHVSNAEVLQAMEKDPLSIAICGYRSSGKSVKALQLTTGASVVPSDDHAVLSGQYPLTRPLTLVIDLGQTDANAKASQEFVRYALCQAGQAQAVIVGFFPVDLPLLRAGLEKLGSGYQTR